MSRRVSQAWTTGIIALAAAVPLAAQSAAPVRDQRYQIGVMESVLEQAVEHGADKTRESMQAVLPPAEMLLATNARVRGFRQEGYGVFFDVDVPTLDTSLPWSFAVLDQNGLGLDSALQAIRAIVQKSNDANLEQALRRIEVQLAPVTVASPFAQQRQQASPAARTVGSASVDTGDTRPIATAPVTLPVQVPPITSIEVYFTQVREALRREVREALIDAMLEHSRGLQLAPNEWLHIAARRAEDRPRLAPIDTNADTMHIRVRGADLTEFLGGKIDRDEAVRRFEVKVN
jgi:hypothetical protein